MDWLSSPLLGVGLIVMVVGFLLITIDVVFIPTIILTSVTLLGWFGFLVYVYSVDANLALFLGVGSLVLGAIYGLLVYKLKLWKVVSHNEKVPIDNTDWQAIIAELNQKPVIAITDLRPVGKIKIDEITYDSLSEEGYIVSGTSLEITGYAEGQYRVVKKKSNNYSD